MNFIKFIAFLLCLIGTLEAKDNRTFAMIKPHAIQEEKTDEIISMIQKAGFVIIAMKKLILRPKQVRQLYQEYKDCPWFKQHVKKFANLPAIVMVLEKKNAVDEWDKHKKLIRAFYYTLSTHNNIVHGSDSQKAARREIALFFKDL